MLLSSSTSIATEIVKVTTEHGKFPAIVIEGLNGGSCDLVVFGAPAPSSKPGEPVKRVGSQFLGNVPYGQKGGDGRTSLFPYWSAD